MVSSLWEISDSLSIFLRELWYPSLFRFGWKTKSGGRKDAFPGCHGDWRAFWFCGIDTPLTNKNHPDTLSFGTESKCIKRHLVNILAKHVRFRGEFGFYTWFCFIVNEKIAPETSTKNSIFVIRKIRMVIVSSLSGIKEKINVINHVRYLMHKELCKKRVGFVWLHTHFSNFRQELDLRTHPSSRVRGPRQSTCLPFPTTTAPVNWSSQISEESLSIAWLLKATGLRIFWVFCVPEQHPQIQLLSLLRAEPESVTVRSPESTWWVTSFIAVTKTVRRRESLFLVHGWKALHQGGGDIAVGVEAAVILHPGL